MALGRVVVATLTGVTAAAGAMVSVITELAAVALAESVTWNTIPVVVPAVVGVPVMTPAELMLSPFGRVPVIVHVYGA